ncbi:Bifunctional purine biosynthesis protein PurH [Frankliniella fusca]|uniref:Bifunctional purine biosynthesis protein PurH n=1 Tax=Frankliniella fusca TaxID=407009 RepID=A0AAE1H2U0_9NEOP|nr:Bifunctional purine biosynthesis protein PurH [Frankliniella fusca]
MFIEVYRLLTTYSLVKPPRGSNVKGGDILSSLLELKDVVGERNEERRRDLEGKIDEIIDGAIPFPENDDMQTVYEKAIDTHSMTYFGGYICRKARKMEPAKSCNECYLEHAVLTSTVNSQIHTMLLFDTLERLTGVELQRVGCEVHARTLTASVVTFYMICRMHFTCADANKVYAETKRRKRDLAKQAKLS